MFSQGVRLPFVIAAAGIAAGVVGACSSEVDTLEATQLTRPADNPAADPTSEPVDPATPPDTEPPPATPIPYPIILEHGAAGWDTTLGWEYFYQVQETLEAAGYRTFTTRVDPFNGIAARGRELALEIDRILAETGAEKVHLIGHSQGGLDARYVVSTLDYGDRVASVTTIGTPHLGCEMIDLALSWTPGLGQAAASALFDIFAGVMTGTETDVAAQMADMSHAHMTEAFNPANPDDPRVAYYSWAGWTQANPLVDTAETDIVIPIFLSSYLITLAVEGTNDGLVSVRSARWGSYFGAVPADHLDEVGMFTAASDPAFDHLDFFLRLAAFLHGAGEPPVYDTTVE